MLKVAFLRGVAPPEGGDGDLSARGVPRSTRRRDIAAGPSPPEGPVATVGRLPERQGARMLRVAAPAPLTPRTVSSPPLPTAIISDVHGNLEALDAVLADIKSRGIDRTICLGDIIGYGPNPVECVD